MAFAWASMFAVVGSCRRKLQLLQPIAGVRPAPLLSALAGAAAPVAAKTASGTAARAAMTARMSPFMSPPSATATLPGAVAWPSQAQRTVPITFLRR